MLFCPNQTHWQQSAIVEAPSVFRSCCLPNTKPSMISALHVPHTINRHDTTGLYSVLKLQSVGSASKSAPDLAIRTHGPSHSRECCLANNRVTNVSGGVLQPPSPRGISSIPDRQSRAVCTSIAQSNPTTRKLVFQSSASQRLTSPATAQLQHGSPRLLLNST